MRVKLLNKLTAFSSAATICFPASTARINAAYSSSDLLPSSSFIAPSDMAIYAMQSIISDLSHSETAIVAIVFFLERHANAGTRYRYYTQLPAGTRYYPCPYSDRYLASSVVILLYSPTPCPSSPPGISWPPQRGTATAPP